MGYVHLYTGNGKGKTTAAFGLALRALGAGLSVYIGQFVKDMRYHETFLGELIGNERLIIEQLGRGCFIDAPPSELDILIAQSAIRHVVQLMTSGSYDVVILDELTIAEYYGLLSTESIINALKQRAKNTEVIITGRYASQALIDYADLVTEMREVKHYYTLYGTLSRPGIDY